MSQIDDPNLEISLASSFNQRGVDGFATAFTNSVDQLKRNSFYEPISNSMSGKRTVYLTKRPGIAISNNSFGDSGQVAYLISLAPGATSAAATQHWVFSTSGNDIRASSNTTTTTIVTAAGYVPAFVGKTHISGTENLVLQLRNASGTQTVWYSTAIATFTQISDADFTGLTILGKMEFMDGFAFVLTNQSRIHNGDLNSLANWTATNYITKEITQDIPASLMKLGNQIIAFGMETMEPFINGGNATGSPLQSVKHLHQRVGTNRQDFAGPTHWYAILGQRAYFIGSSAGKSNDGVYVYDGARMEKVSTPAIDKILIDAGDSQGIGYSVYPFGFHGKTAIAIQLDLTTAATQRWLMFFPEWNEWFEWNSTTFTPVNSGQFFLGVGANQHRIYQFGAGADSWQDNGTDYTWLHQFKLPTKGNRQSRMHMCGLVGDTARSALNIDVQFSDDDGQTWSTARPIDMTQYKKTLYRNGAFRNRSVRLSHAGNLEVRLEKFLARIE